MIYQNTKFRVLKSWALFVEGEIIATDDDGYLGLSLNPLTLDLALAAGFIELADKPWEPKEEEKYWIVDSDCPLSEIGWYFGPVPIHHRECGNYFKTEQAAKNAAEKIKELLSNLPKE